LNVLFRPTLIILLLALTNACDNSASSEDFKEKDIPNGWSGSESDYDQRFKHKEVDGVYLLHDLEETGLFSGRIRILDSDDSLWLQHEYSNGVEDGERIVWVDGKIYERYLYKNGKLVETLVKMGKPVK